MACSTAHDKVFAPVRSRMSVLLNEETCLSIPIICTQCEEPTCVEACPVDALYRDENTHAILCDEAKCIGCGLCAKNCALGAIKFNRKDKEVVKCDLCGGDPECIKVCPNEAITFVDATAENLEKRNQYIQLYKELSKEVG